MQLPSGFFEPDRSLLVYRRRLPKSILTLVLEVRALNIVIFLHHHCCTMHVAVAPTGHVAHLPHPSRPHRILLHDRHFTWAS